MRQNIIKTNRKRIWRECELDSSGSGQGLVTIRFEENNKLLGFVKDWEFVDQLGYFQLLIKTSSPMKLVVRFKLSDQK